MKMTAGAGLGAGLLWALAASAQTPAAAPVVVPDKAAMDRAQQQADGPKRRILEAARLKPVVKVVADAPVAAAAAATPAPVHEAEPTVATLPAAAAPLAVTAASVSGVAAVAPLELATGAAAMLALPAAQASSLPAAAHGLPPPKLVSMVEPDLPPRLFQRGGRRSEVVVDFTVNTDGSVGNVVVRSASNPNLEPPVLEAVRQWRYEAQPVPRPHVVRLVVNPG